MIQGWAERLALAAARSALINACCSLQPHTKVLLPRAHHLPQGAEAVEEVPEAGGAPRNAAQVGTGRLGHTRTRGGIGVAGEEERDGRRGTGGWGDGGRGDGGMGGWGDGGTGGRGDGGTGGGGERHGRLPARVKGMKWQLRGETHR
jgi:hypothetical protein